MSEMPSQDAPDGYIAGFRDGFIDYMIAQGRRDWSAGFQHGFQIAQQRVSKEGPLGYTDGMISEDFEIWEEPSESSTEPIPLTPSRSEPGPRRTDEQLQPDRVPREDPVVPPQTTEDEPHLLPPLKELQAPREVEPSTDERVPMRTTPDRLPPEDDLFLDAPPPTEEPQPAEADDDEAGDIEFDDLFAPENDERSDTRALPGGRLRSLTKLRSNAASDDEPQLRIRFKEASPTVSKSEVRPAVGESTDLGLGVAPVGYHASPSEGIKSEPTRNWSDLFRNPNPNQSRSAVRTRWDSRFTVDPTKEVLIDSPLPDG